WARSLMVFTYSFIHHSIARAANPPPFEIPELRFVNAGVALVHEQLSGPMVNVGKSVVSRSYLLEEMIDEQRDGFHKFITNASAVPLSLRTRDKSLPVIAEFLAFTQHVQYYKTGGLAYLSDLQGIASLLTDPQIMTSPSIANGGDLFGDGNLAAASDAFPEQHICNRYCEWFALPAVASATAGQG
ncbi:hypothetical protein C8R46DRAFT_884835, partial [Mycena filopes]